jgi:Flp pilus assembly protein TadD
VGWTAPGSERELASTLADRAIALDEADPWAHVALGILALTGRGTDEAVRHFGATLDLNPNFSTAAGFVGFAQFLDGRSEEALGSFERAMRISPRDPFNSFFFVGIAGARYQQGGFAEAADWARQAVQLRPGFIAGYRILCASLARAGRLEEAKTVLATLQRMAPGMSVASLRQSLPYTNQRTMENFLDGLRLAGLPD